jgi:pSer/pThr/pTyr-binding forkhead associated (FHA) protein
VRLVSKTGQSQGVSEQSFVVGSGPGAKVKLAGPAVAAEHARFDWRGRKLFLTDLESARGTFYDGNRLMPGVAYAAGAGAVLEFGDAANSFVLEFDVQPQQSGSIDQALATAFLAKFEASSSAQVREALKDQQL